MVLCIRMYLKYVWKDTWFIPAWRDRSDCGGVQEFGIGVDSRD